MHEPAARLGLMSTLLWDFVQLDLTSVSAVGISCCRSRNCARRSGAARRSICARSTGPRAVAGHAHPLFETPRTSVQAQRQFIANTAHQLRTPITGMQAQLELLAAEPAGCAHRTSPRHVAGATAAVAFGQSIAQPRARRSHRELRREERACRVDAIVGEVVAKFFAPRARLEIDLGAEVQPVLADSSLSGRSAEQSRRQRAQVHAGHRTVSAGATRQALHRGRGHGLAAFQRASVCTSHSASIGCPTRRDTQRSGARYRRGNRAAVRRHAHLSMRVRTAWGTRASPANFGQK